MKHTAFPHYPAPVTHQNLAQLIRSATGYAKAGMAVPAHVLEALRAKSAEWRPADLHPLVLSALRQKQARML